MAIEDDYTEERLAEYDAAATAQDDVIVMGFVTVVRNLRARVAELEPIVRDLAEHTVCSSLHCMHAEHYVALSDRAKQVIAAR